MESPERYSGSASQSLKWQGWNGCCLQETSYFMKSTGKALVRRKHSMEMTSFTMASLAFTLLRPFPSFYFKNGARGWGCSSVVEGFP
jgi:hypothetical protein